MTSLSGKTALVTGASRGIGRASALALAKGGAQVLVHYGRGGAEAEAVVKEIRNVGGRADAVAMDLAARDGAHKLAKHVRSIVGDRLDILVANAGVAKAATIEDTTTMISTTSSPSTSGRLSSSSSNCSRSWVAAAASFSSLRSPRTPPSVRSRPMRRQRAPSTRW